METLVITLRMGSWEGYPLLKFATSFMVTIAVVLCVLQPTLVFMRRCIVRHQDKLQQRPWLL